jgi:hypothetical protein
MKYENTKDYPEVQFRHICGMKRKTFEKALEILHAAYAEEHSKNLRKSGYKPKLGMEDKLLAALEYRREYRTLTHIGARYDMDESNIRPMVKRVENAFITSRAFRFPGTKTPLAPACEYEIILSDAAEYPLNALKKQRTFYIRKEERPYRERTGCREQG